jgi:hypothetical protein
MLQRMDALSLYEAAGLLGVALYVTAYGLLQFSALRYGHTTFTALNLCAASLVAVSLVEDFNLASALIQGMWIAMSIVGLGRRLATRRVRVEPVRRAPDRRAPRVAVSNVHKVAPGFY